MPALSAWDSQCVLAQGDGAE